MALATQVNKSSPTNFELVFPLIPRAAGFKDNDELTLNIFSTIIPSLTLETGIDDWMGTKRTKATGKAEWEQWNVNFLVDSEFKNWQLLFKWIMYINNSKDKFSEDYKNYTVDATLRIIDNFHNETLKIFFVDVWPNMLGEVSLSQREGESLLECQASFVYNRFEIRAIE